MKNLITLIVVIVVIIILFIVYFTKNKQKGSFNINDIRTPLKCDIYYNKCHALLLRLNIIQNALNEIQKIINSFNDNTMNITKLRITTDISNILANVNKIKDCIYKLNDNPGELYRNEILQLQDIWDFYSYKLVKRIKIIKSFDYDESKLTVLNDLHKNCDNMLAKIDSLAYLINRDNINFINELRNKSNDYLLEQTFAYYYPNSYTHI